MTSKNMTTVNLLKEKGFRLFEVLITIVILGKIATIVKGEYLNRIVN
ncbi:hypothetical protein M3175_15710 [Robertmurraya korlensis]|nr:hypothetical protein [Robertmurraya korlensis]MCM3602189.1 hypothetical protein [Robertmurraya korlensis]